MSTQPANTTSRSRLVNFMSIGAVVILVVAFFVSQFQILEDYISRNNWVQTSATVVEVNSKTHWLTYQYDVDGTTYIGTRLSITHDTDSELGIPAKAENYPEGRELTIYYNPDNPTRSAVSIEADFSDYLIIFVGLIGLIIVYWIIKRIARTYLQFIGNLLTGNAWRD